MWTITKYICVVIHPVRKKLRCIQMIDNTDVWKDTLWGLIVEG